MGERNDYAEYCNERDHYEEALEERNAMEEKEANLAREKQEFLDRAAITAMGSVHFASLFLFKDVNKGSIRMMWDIAEALWAERQRRYGEG